MANLTITKIYEVGHFLKLERKLMKKRFSKTLSVFVIGILPISVSACTNYVPTPEGSNESELSLPELSPLDEFRNILWGMGMDEEAARRQWDAGRIRQENMIAECMHELGFEYIPDIGRMTLQLPGDSWQPDEMEWVSEYGYGVITSPPGAVPERTTGSIFIRPDNPNLPMFNELTESEQRAYLKALHGGSPDTFTRVVDGWDFHDCHNWSYGVINLERQVWRNDGDEFAPLLEAITEMQARLRTDIIEADREWADCMLDAGYPQFERQTGGELYFKEVWQEFTSTWDWQQGRPDPATSPEVAELQEREIRMATADLDCRIAVDFAAKRSAHITQVEEQFITDHKEALQALRSAFEQQD
jgi:hypothetical protein